MSAPPAPRLVVLRLRGSAVVDVQYHQAGEVQVAAPGGASAGAELARQAALHPAAWIAWYDVRVEAYLRDPAGWPELPAHPLEVLHLSTAQRCDRMAAGLGFVDFTSPFLIPGPAEGRFPTWLVSPLAGIGRGAVFAAVGLAPTLGGLAVALFDWGFRAQAAGVCLCADSRLLAAPIPTAILAPLQTPLTTGETATLIGRLHRKQWLAFWAVARRRPVGPRVLWRGWRAPVAPSVDRAALAALRPPLPAASSMAAATAIIPTMGRADHLLNVLADLAAQTCPPRAVVVIEQAPPGTDYAPLPDLAAQDWPFTVRHERVTWAGACRARNLALAGVTTPWVLLLDDDIRLPAGWVAHLLDTAAAYGVGAVTSALYLPGQAVPACVPGAQPWPGFASGVSLVSRALIAVAGGFDRRLEGGYGEDNEFGVRLRRAGSHVLYTAAVPVLHLKAPVGGFRYQFPHPWAGASPVPRPSPTVLFALRKHATPEQMAGYRLSYWLNQLRQERPWRWPATLARVRREWRAADRWAQYLAARPAGDPES